MANKGKYLGDLFKYWHGEKYSCFQICNCGNFSNLLILILIFWDFFGNFFGIFSPQRNREFVTEYSFSKRFFAKRWKKKKNWPPKENSVVKVVRLQHAQGGWFHDVIVGSKQFHDLNVCGGGWKGKLYLVEWDTICLIMPLGGGCGKA